MWSQRDVYKDKRRKKIEKIFKMYVKRNGACVLAPKLHVPTPAEGVLNEVRGTVSYQPDALPLMEQFWINKYSASISSISGKSGKFIN